MFSLEVTATHKWNQAYRAEQRVIRGHNRLAHRRAQGDQGKQREGPGTARQDQSLRAQAEEAGARRIHLR